MLLLVPLAVACSVSSESSFDALGGDRKTSGENVGAGATENATSPPALSGTDAGVAPLCGDLTQCTPDDDGVIDLAGKPSCATRAPADPDGGGAKGGKPVDASTADFACRVSPTNAPTCPSEPNADTKGVDGVDCQSDVDCAPGYDCVAAATGNKGNVCRRYCCSSSCDGVTSQNGGPTFCDFLQVVRSQATTGLSAPVCMPIKTCTLLKEGECGAGETCAIVNDKGATGCVLTDGAGSAKQGESCERKHCEAGHTCLGSPGDRTCYKLCKTSGQDCGPGQVCTTGSAFLDTSFGVCKNAT